MSAASPSEWAAAGCLGLSAISLIALALAFADADLGYFDPRYQLARVTESGRLDPLLISVANAKHGGRPVAAHARHIPRDAAITVAALLLLLSAPSASEATR